MLLIVGLGNPGVQYARNRHNVGFMAADTIHHRNAFPGWRRRFSGEAAEAPLGGDKCLLLKPLTYMNDSGRPVREAAHFYKLAPADIVVIHDEVDLAPGKFRMKAGGGTAGHNGLRSISAAIGDGFRRLRIGVGHPGVKELVPNYVLRDFAKEDARWLVPLLDAVADNAALLAEGQDQTFANRVHEALGPPEPRKAKTARRDATAATAAADEPAPAKLPEPAASTRPEGTLARGLRKLFGR